MPKINPKIIISIIIPVYNSERFLQDCLDSVLVQNSNNIEIIIIDDCSTDNSNQICNLYCENNDNIYLITNKTRVGVSSSRNIGLAIAGGKYIIFLDSDDLLIKNTIKKLIIFLNNFKIVDIVVIKKHLIKRGNKLINSNEIISNINNNTNIVDNFLSNNQNQVFKECWAFIYNRNYLLDNQILFIPNINFAEDQEFTAKVFCLSESLTYYDIPIYCFRQSQGSLSHNNGYDICISCLKVINEMTKFIRKYNLSHDKKIFMTKSIGTVINELTPMLICLNNHEIKNLTHFIIKYFDNKSLNMLIDNENVFYYINQLGSYNGMIKYKSIYSQQIINLVKNAKNMQIYVFQ